MNLSALLLNELSRFVTLVNATSPMQFLVIFCKFLIDIMQEKHMDVLVFKQSFIKVVSVFAASFVGN